MFVDGLFETENLFPLYNWNIFHTTPSKYRTQDFLLIHSLDGKVLNPPKDILDMQPLFPDVAFYTLTNKIRGLKLHFYDPQKEVLLIHINENLNRHFDRVEWELVEQRFDVIEYYLSHSVLKTKSFGRFIAEKKKT